MLLSSLANSTVLQELPHLQIQPLSSMTEFYPQRGFALDAALSAISGGFRSCKCDGISLVRTRRIFAVAAKIINRLNGLERKFIILNSAKA